MPRAKKYTEEDLELALMALEEGGSLRKVAAEYGVPHTTLQDWKKGKYAHLPHPNRALLPNEEEALVGYIFWMAAHAFPITMSVALVLAFQICKASGRINPFLNMEKGLSKMWWSRFRARHPAVASRRPNYIETERVHGATVARVDELFHICQALYDQYGFSGTPELIYNCDETGFGDKGSSRKRILCGKSQKTVYAQQVTAREHVTVHCCAKSFVPCCITGLTRSSCTLIITSVMFLFLPGLVVILHFNIHKCCVPGAYSLLQMLCF